MEREAFMSYDFRQMFAPMAKWVAQIDDASRIPEFVQRAFHLAMSGRKGPVVLVLPEDVLEEEHAVADANPAILATSGAPSSRDMDRLFVLLRGAERPLMIVGGSGWTDVARDSVQRFVERNDMPVVTTFRRRDIIDNRHRCYGGEIGIGSNPALLGCIKESDLVLVLNDSLSDVNTIGQGYMEGFTLFEVPMPRQALIHVHSAIEELNRVYQADLAIVSESAIFADTLAAHEPIPNARWHGWTAQLRGLYEEDYATSACVGPIDLPHVFKWLRERLPDDAIVTNGVGAYAGWSQRYFQHYRLHTQLGPISGAMGYGVPAAICAKLLYPERVVVAVAGDGCFLMTSDELATAAKYNVAIIVLVINNNMYGTIRIHQENRFGGRAVGTALVNPDFVMYARAFGMQGERVLRTDEFAPAFERCMASGRPALIELRIDPDAIHTRYSLSVLQARRAARSREPDNEGSP